MEIRKPQNGKGDTRIATDPRPSAHSNGSLRPMARHGAAEAPALTSQQAAARLRRGVFQNDAFEATAVGQGALRSVANAPVPPAGPVEPSRAVLNRNHQVTSLRGLAALLDRPDVELEPETRQLLATSPALVATLAGGCAMCVLPQAEAALDARIEADVAALADAMSFATGQRFAMRLLTRAPQVIALVNLSVVSSMPDMEQVFRDETRTALRGGSFASGSPEHAAALAFHDTHKDAVDAMHADWKTQTMAAPTPVSTTPREVGMLSCCRAADDFAGLEKTLRAWANSLTLYGRIEDVTLRLSDDSPPAQAAEVARLASRIEADTGMRIEVIDKATKWRVVADVVKRAMADPVLQTRLKLVGVPSHEARAALFRLFVDPDRNKAAQPQPSLNRNFSILLLSRPGFQCDDDNRPEAMTASFAKRKAEHLHLIGSGTDESERIRAQETIEHASLIPVDLFGFYERCAPGTIGSPLLTGAVDASVSSIVLEPKALEAWEFGKDAAFEASSYRHRTSYESTRVPLWSGTVTGEERVRAPVFLPSRRSGRPAPCPLNPPIRDGDMAFAPVLREQHSAPSKLPFAIHQSTPGGSRAGPGLLRSTASSSSTWTALSKWTEAEVAKGRPRTSSELGEQLYRHIAQLGSVLSSSSTTPRDPGFILRHLEHALEYCYVRFQHAELLEHRAEVLLSDDVGSSASDILRGWYVGTVSSAHQAAAEAQVQELTASPERRAAIAHAMREAATTLREESAKMGATFGFADHTKIDDQFRSKFAATIEAELNRALQDYAIGLMAWDVLERVSSHLREADDSI